MLLEWHNLLPVAVPLAFLVSQDYGSERLTVWTAGLIILKRVIRVNSPERDLRTKVTGIVASGLRELLSENGWHHICKRPRLNI